VVGYFLTVWPLMVRNGFIIFDRYYYDLLLDPRRYRYGAPMWLARFVSYLVPKPDLIIILDAPVNIIHARKQEVTEEQTECQRLSYREFAELEENCKVVSADQPIEKVVSDVNKMILNYMSKRTGHRIGW